MKVIIAKNSGLEILCDDDDYHILSRYVWYTHKSKTTFYARTTVGNIQVHMHRFILGKAPSRKYNTVIDHINRNGLDNQKENLRWVTYSHNYLNSEKPKQTSKYLGVSRRALQKYTAKIRRDGVAYNLGIFKTEIEAAKAYDKKALELDGPDACINFPAHLETAG